MNDLDYPAIGGRIKMLRKRKGLNQTELAQRLKKSLRTVQKYETGEIKVSIAVVNQIADILETTSACILGYESGTTQIKTQGDVSEKILKRDFSEDFVRKMRNRMLVSHYKYGWVKDTYPELADAVASLEQRLALYKKTGNTEHLIDVANFAMIEFMFPRHPNAHFEAGDSDSSPGLVGISYKQMLEEMGQIY